MTLSIDAHVVREGLVASLSVTNHLHETAVLRLAHVGMRLGHLALRVSQPSPDALENAQL